MAHSLFAQYLANGNPGTFSNIGFSTDSAGQQTVSSFAWSPRGNLPSTSFTNANGGVTDIPTGQSDGNLFRIGESTLNPEPALSRAADWENNLNVTDDEPGESNEAEEPEEAGELTEADNAALGEAGEAERIMDTAADITTVAESTEAAAGVLTGGLPMAAIAASQIAGNAVNNALSTTATSNTDQTRINNIDAGRGLNVVRNADIIHSYGASANAMQSLGGGLGALIGGPMGAFLGRAAGSLFNSNQVPISALATAYGSMGRIDPQSNGVADYDSTAYITNDNMTNGVQTSGNDAMDTNINDNE